MRGERLGIDEVPRARNLRTRLAIVTSALTGTKTFAVDDVVQLGNTLYGVTFCGPTSVVLRNASEGKRLTVSRDGFGNVRLVRRAPRNLRPRAS